MKLFFLSALRLATALFLAGTALAIVIATFIWAKEERQRRGALQYESAKEWTADLRDNIGLNFQAKTKLVSGKLFLSVTAEGNPSYLNDPKIKPLNRNAQLHFQFVDADDFFVLTKSVDIVGFSSIVDEKGHFSGLRTQQEDYISIEDYKRFHRMRVGWNLVTEAPLEPSAAESRPQLNLDHCAPNLSRKERLRRLSALGPLREMGNDGFKAGDGYMYFSYDGSLLNCQ